MNAVLLVFIDNHAMLVELGDERELSRAFRHLAPYHTASRSGIVASAYHIQLAPLVVLKF